MSDITLEGFDEFEKELTKIIEVEFPREFEQMIIDVALELQGAIKERTPVKTSYLQDHWFIGKVIKKGNEYSIEIYNNTDYVEPVEYGHRLRGGKGYKEGAHMMEVSVSLIQSRLPDHVRMWLSNFISTHEF